MIKLNLAKLSKVFNVICLVSGNAEIYKLILLDSKFAEIIKNVRIPSLGNARSSPWMLY